MTLFDELSAPTRLPTLTICDYTFVGPVEEKAIPSLPGVYAPLAVSAFSQWILDVGQSNDMAHRVRFHERLSCWLNHLLPGESLMFAAYYIPGRPEFSPDTNEIVRKFIEGEIRQRIKPPCGEV